MAISNLFGNFSSFMKGINLRKFKTLSRLCAEDPSNAYQILKKEFFQQMREVAIRQIHKENEDIINGMSFEEKEELIAQREKDLWQKVKSGGTTAFALIFGISIGG